MDTEDEYAEEIAKHIELEDLVAEKNNCLKKMF